MQRLGGVMRDCFANQDLVVDRATTSADVQGWDSITHVRLLLMVETVFKVKFGYLERKQLKNVGDLVDAITLKIESTNE